MDFSAAVCSYFWHVFMQKNSNREQPYCLIIHRPGETENSSQPPKLEGFQTFPFPVPIIILVFSSHFRAHIFLAKRPCKAARFHSFDFRNTSVLLCLFSEGCITWVFPNISCVQESLLYSQRIISP